MIYTKNINNLQSFTSMNDEDFAKLFPLIEDKRIHGVIFKVVNTINGRIFIDDTESAYPKDFKNDINKYGFEKFDKTIIAICYDKYQLIIAKNIAIWNYNSRHPQTGYNLNGIYREKFDINQVEIRKTHWGSYPAVYIKDDKYYLFLSNKDRDDFYNCFGASVLVETIKTDTLNGIRDKYPGIKIFKEEEYYIVKTNKNK